MEDNKMKINDIRGETSKEIKAVDIPEGTYFSGKIGSYDSRFFVKGRGIIMDLENPYNVWEVRPGYLFLVSDYRTAEVEIIFSNKK